MRNYIIILLFFFTFLLSAQKGSTPFTQQEWLDRAQKSIMASNQLNTLASYYYAYIEDPETAEGKRALSLSDSLKFLMQEKIIKDIQGQWKLTSSGSNWGFSTADNNIQNILVIIGKDAVFSEVNLNNMNSKILRKEKLNFVQPSSSDYGYYHVLAFIYSDSTVWNYHLNGKRVLHIIQVGDFLNGHINEIVCGNSEYYYTKLEN